MISKGSYRKSKLSQGCLSEHLLGVDSPEDDVQKQEQFELQKKYTVCIRVFQRSWASSAGLKKGTS